LFEREEGEVDDPLFGCGGRLAPKAGHEQGEARFDGQRAQLRDEQTPRGIGQPGRQKGGRLADPPIRVNQIDADGLLPRRRRSFCRKISQSVQRLTTHRGIAIASQPGQDDGGVCSRAKAQRPRGPRPD
jgi:hypothetical protein